MNVRDDTCTTLVMDGARGVATAEDTLASLRQALADSGSVAIDCTGLTSADLGFIQLLLAAQRSATAAGGSIRVKAQDHGPLHAALTAGGFLAAPDLCSFIEFVA